VADASAPRTRRFRSPRRYFAELTAGEPLFPLLVLFGLNAVDELDRTAFGVLTPDIADAFGLSLGQMGALVALTGIASLLVEVPLGYSSDRLPRARLAIAGAAIWALFGGLTGLAGAVWVLVIARTGAGAGRAVVSPTHNSLLSDYYPPEVRPDVFGFHRIANGVGAFLGPLLGGLLAYRFDWRVPFLVFVIPTLVIVFIGRRMREPGRGRFERAASGADAAVIETDEAPPSFTESVRILMQVRTLRRIWIALPFTFGPILGFGFLLSFYYTDVFGLNAFQRGAIAAATEPMQIVAIIIGIPLASRMMLRDPGLGLRLLAVFAVGISIALVGFVVAPSVWVAVVANICASALGALLMPGILASLSLVMPPKVRSLGFALGSVFAIPGMVFLAIAASIADAFSLRIGMLVMVPIFLVGAWILSSASLYVRKDINRVWTSTAAQAEVRLKRSQGEVKLLLTRGLDVHYDGVQVLFGIDLEIDEGEIVALLGTNGAGKSTLLKAVSGLVEATNGAIVFDGRDMTYAPPDEVAGRGVVLFPGGQGVFPTLTVAEHLRLASWLHRRDRDAVAASREHVLELFPILRDRLDEPAGNLSGGQQQMLALGMAFIERPRLLMIDELSLGLAPAVVEQLLPIVRDLADRGTTIIIVEQSVNLALTLARTAYFMEKGEIRFHGPTAELLERPDVLRSVFLEGAATAAGSTGSDTVPPVGDDAHPVTTRETTPLAVVGDAPVRLGLTEVSKRFRGIAALTEVTLDARAGEILGFIGPNGAGKTTLFDVISGFTRADSGRILLGEGSDAVDIGAKPPAARSRLGLGRSFQDGRLFSGLTVAEVIAVAFERHLETRDPVAAALHLPWVEETEHQVRFNVERLLETFGIADFRDKLARELSTGSRRIVDLACVVAHGPRVLLLDEPSSGIAQREAEALGPLLLRIREETGATLLVVEHDVPLLLGIADRLVALDLGQVVAVGEPEQVVHDPRVVQSYLGSGKTAVARSGTRGG